MPISQDYDKIVKENFKPNVLPLLELIFNMKVKSAKSISVKLQHTIEKEPDFLFLVETETPNEEHILQVEFQAPDKRHRNQWVFRGVFYKGFLLLEKRKPVIQYFVYMGDGPCPMNDEYKDITTRHKINIIDLKEIDYEKFLNAGKPELVVFAVLGNFKQQHPQAVISNIIQKLKRLTHGPLELKKYTSQLRILSKLRKFEDLTFKIIKDAITI